MNVVLTGFMASGKSAVGDALAKLMKRKIVDTDEMIINYAGKSINRIFSEDGEERFRELEHEIIKKASKMNDTIISTGGGVPLNKRNMDILRENGVIVNISPEFEIIMSRLNGSSRAVRPLVKNQSEDQIRKRYESRREFYDNCDIKIHITKEAPVMETAKRVLSELNKKGII